jgi:hypothetical protein
MARQLPKRSKLEDARAELLGPFLESTKKGLEFLNPDAADAEVVLSATSALDRLLRIAISSSFRTSVSSDAMADIFEGNGPLSTFDAKIRVGVAFLLLRGDYVRDINTVRSIRSSFAHSVSVKRFTDEDISYRCQRLKISHPDIDKSAIQPEARRRFVGSCLRTLEFLIVTLSISAHATDIVVKYREEVQRGATALAIVLAKEAGFMTDSEFNDFISMATKNIQVD